MPIHLTISVHNQLVQATSGIERYSEPHRASGKLTQCSGTWARNGGEPKEVARHQSSVTDAEVAMKDYRENEESKLDTEAARILTAFAKTSTRRGLLSTVGLRVL